MPHIFFLELYYFLFLLIQILTFPQFFVVDNVHHSLLVIVWSYEIVSKPQMFTETIMYSSLLAAQLTGDPIHQVLHSAVTTIRQIRANLTVSQSTFQFVV